MITGTVSVHCITYYKLNELKADAFGVFVTCNSTQTETLSNQDVFPGLFLSHTLPTEIKSFCKQ